MRQTARSPPARSALVFRWIRASPCWDSMARFCDSMLSNVENITNGGIQLHRSVFQPRCSLLQSSSSRHTIRSLFTDWHASARRSAIFMPELHRRPDGASTLSSSRSVLFDFGSPRSDPHIGMIVALS